jgi:ribosomal protein S19
MRSLWKGNFVDIKRNIINKSSVVLSTFLRTQFRVHNGKNIGKLLIKREMVGAKIGEFIFTRKMKVTHKKKDKKKKKK